MSNSPTKIALADIRAVCFAIFIGAGGCASPLMGTASVGSQSVPRPRLAGDVTTERTVDIDVICEEPGGRRR